MSDLSQRVALRVDRAWAYFAAHMRQAALLYGGLFGVTGVVLGWATYPQWMARFFEITDPIKPGEFGDTFGALNALFSGLAFCVISLTLIVQYLDLKESRLIAKEQKNVLLSQRNDGTFFSWLELQAKSLAGFTAEFYLQGVNRPGF